MSVLQPSDILLHAPPQLEGGHRPLEHCCVLRVGAGENKEECSRASTHNSQPAPAAKRSNKPIMLVTVHSHCRVDVAAAVVQRWCWCQIQGIYFGGLE